MNVEEAEPVISVRNVGVVYRQRTGFLKTTSIPALKDVSFDLYHGESLGIIGRNGSGKSTILKLLANIIVPDSGVILNQGYTTTLLSLQLGFDPALTGRQNAILSGIMLGMERAQVEDKLDEISDFSELGEFMNLPLRTYSTGMRARLGFSVAFSLDPDILLVDEVLGVGDVEFQRKSRRKLTEKITSDKTVVLISHNAQVIRELCNRAVWIDGGIAHLEGPTDEVLLRYNNYLNKLTV